VLFGQYQISEYIGAPAYADRYEAAMRRRFPGLEITNVALCQAVATATARNQLFGV